ncbi:DUF1697 domain-containing protein [Candidatus Woesebacteria bacterium]|nr:DUF1697 domain-containing protein [Candidatus Woesebacteria bacterium]
MNDYIVLLRGINVGGKNKMPMVDLKKCLEELGFTEVVTYIASGNVILKSQKKPAKIQSQIEKALPKQFQIDSKLIKVLVLTDSQLKTVVSQKPGRFGEQPEKYHSDVIFLINLSLTQALSVFDPRKDIDKIWPGEGVIYSQRLSSQRSKSRLNKIVGTTAYKNMTIRNWNTVTKLLEMVNG